jgi:ParB family transcriptional regulator, chromosome partitioning protein
MDTKTKKIEKKPVLGRGLSAILGGGNADGDANEQAPQQAQLAAIQEIETASIEVNPFQPRTHFDEDALQELADSIREHGIVQPITVRRLSEGSYQLISGERRLQAVRRLSLKTVPAYIRTANDEQMLELALIENIQRQELNPIEISLGYQRLMDECKLTFEEVGVKVGKKRSTVNNYLRLLKLPPAIQTALRDGSLGMGHARAMISVENPLVQLDIFNQIILQDLSVRQVEALVGQLAKPATPTPSQPKKAATSARELALLSVEKRIEKKLGTRVAVAQKEDGSGEIRIRFFSEEELNRLTEQLG